MLEGALFWGSPALNVHQTCQCVWTWCWPSALTASRSRLEDDQLQATTTTKHHQMSKSHHLSSQALGFQMLARGRSCSKQEQYAAVTNYALPSPSPRTHRAFFFQLPSTVLQLSTNSVSLGIVWSIWQKCGGPQSETANVISNWMSQSLVSFQGDHEGQNCSVRAAGEVTCVALLSTSAWPFISGRKHWSHRAIISSDTSYSGSGETFLKILASSKCKAKSWQSPPRESCTINIKIEFR